MLKCWTLHNQYRQFISDGADSLSESDFLRLQGSYRKPKKGKLKKRQKLSVFKSGVVK
ncbi:hypothetical protein [Anaeromicropila populeti]|uniref:Uncharacterized protein n=1 Tax=Anaeromicropila populeti TaxID=37658 RepID=A0A1I6IWQ0_9FIRM|nr:hypothetical protein [Anaeromicropila populeti]SFR71137.1 hypothetical protein SAMN05661086_01193 [Anaeromicropila populeti]